MSKLEKQLKRLSKSPTDFTFHELSALLTGLGFYESNSGKTSGSAVCFTNHNTGQIIRLHKPHPAPIMKQYLVKFVIEQLKQRGYIDG